MTTITQSEVIKNHIDNMLSQLYTSMPAEVLAVKKKGNMTVVDVQPMLNMRIKDGRVIQEPPLGNVPIMWQRAGGCFITMPIEVGDEVMLHFSMRSIAEYKNSTGGEPQTASSMRLHNMNDAYATPSTTTYQNGLTAASEGLEMSSGEVEIMITKEGEIKLGKEAVESIIKGDTFNAYFSELLTSLLTHTHPVSGNTAAASADLLIAIEDAFPKVGGVNSLKADAFSTISFTE